MPAHEIWAEGFPKQGGNATAVCLATIEAEDFHAACLELIKTDEMFRKYFDKRKSSFMGCKIYASEEKARKRWG